MLKSLGPLSRRGFLTALGAAAGAAAFISRIPVARARSVGGDALLGDLAPGTRLDAWRVVAVHRPTAGAIPVILEGPDGERFQVDVMRRDPAGPDGVAVTPSLSLSLANRGDGRTATPESHGLGARALAEALARREAAGARVPRLLTLAERMARHPDGRFRVPV
jgi:hypothetical protein